jgi:XTP/dITP diphosphohydrolase
MQTVVLASSNQGKLKELATMLAPLAWEFKLQSVLGVPDAPEPHNTFVENALAKARWASERTGLPALADDSGLAVDALQGAPGVWSARYACESDDAPRSDVRNNEKLLAALDGVQDRSATFVCVLVLVRHADDPLPVIAQGLWRGQILTALIGSKGFGYDPLFFDPVAGLGAAQMAEEQKNRLSHRGKAIASLLAQLS